MKIQVIYSSLSGQTKKVAQAIFDAVAADDKTLHDLKDGEPALDGDVLLLGYWVDKGGPNAEMKAFLPKIQGKAVGIFCTLGYYADSSHAQKSLDAGIALVKEQNILLGSYVCNGALSESIIARFRKAGTSGPHSASPENELRWEILQSHPTQAELNLAAERFRERAYLYQKYRENGLAFSSIV